MQTRIVAPPALEFRFDWDRREFVRGSKAVRQNMRGARWWRPLLWAGLFVMMVTLLPMLWEAPESRPSLIAVLWPWLLFFAMWIPLMGAIMPWVSARAQDRHFGPGQHAIKATLSDEGYATDNGKGVTSVYWNGVLHAAETPEFFLFFYTPQCAHYLPTRAVVPEQFPAVRALIRAKLGDRAKLLAS